MQTEAGKKLVPLEGIRGIAAIIVLLYHFTLCFTLRGVQTIPTGHGVLDPIFRFLLCLLNGSAAVAVFFVLSGFILSLSFAKDQKLSRILTAILKRWPRLAALPVAGCLFAWVMIIWSGSDYSAAAQIIGSNWLATHGNGPITGQSMTWTGAIAQGLVTIFTTGNVSYDTPLWTMRIELYGSLATFLVAPLLFALRNPWARAAAVVAVAVLAGIQYPFTYITDFLIGTLLAMLFTSGRLPSFSNWQAAALGALTIYLFSFTYEQVLPIHAPLKAIMPHGDTSHFIWDISAALMILLVFGNPALRRLFSGSWATRLGALSFPIYLLHVPILLSVGAATFLWATPHLGQTPAALLAAFLCLIVTVACATPLVRMDEEWGTILGRVTRHLTHREHVPAKP